MVERNDGFPNKKNGVRNSSPYTFVGTETPFSECSNEKLKEFFSDRNITAFVEYYVRHANRLARASSRVTRSKDGQDVVQMVFTAMYKNINHKCPQNPDAYIYRAVTNRAKDMAQDGSIICSLDAPIPNTANSSGSAACYSDIICDTSDDGSPEGFVCQSESIGSISGALISLKDEYREVIVLHDIQGLDYEQISNMLEVGEDALRTRLFRARRALRKKLSKDPYFADEISQRSNKLGSHRK